MAPAIAIPIALAVAGGGIGAMIDKKKPLRGALLGAAAGGTGGLAAPAIGGALGLGAAGAGAASASPLAVAGAGGGGAASPLLSAFPLTGGLMPIAGGTAGLGAGSAAGGLTTAQVAMMTAGQAMPGLLQSLMQKPSYPSVGGGGGIGGGSRFQIPESLRYSLPRNARSSSLLQR